MRLVGLKIKGFKENEKVGENRANGTTAERNLRYYRLASTSNLLNQKVINQKE